MKYPRDTIQVTDGDWASSDKVILACSDHCLRIYEMNLTDCTSSLEFQTIQRLFFVFFFEMKFKNNIDFLEATLSPYLIPARHANLLKHLLCVTNGSIDELINKCEDNNLKTLLEKDIAKLDQ